MFEREAEEYCMHQSLLEDVRDNICKAFEDGAKFEYNKCNAKLTKAKEILRKFLDAKSIEERCVAESEADKFLSEIENNKGE